MYLISLTVFLTVQEGTCKSAWVGTKMGVVTTGTTGTSGTTGTTGTTGVGKTCFVPGSTVFLLIKLIYSECNLVKRKNGECLLYTERKLYFSL